MTVAFASAADWRIMPVAVWARVGDAPLLARDLSFHFGALCVETPMMNPETAVMTLPVPHPDVVARALPDGCVLFHPQTEVYFGLNETGTVIWNAIAAGAASEEVLVQAVMARWPDAPQTDVYCHVRELLADLSVEGLLVDVALPQG